MLSQTTSWSMGKVMISMIDIYYKSWISVGRLDSNWIQTSANLVRSRSNFMATLSALKVWNQIQQTSTSLSRCHHQRQRLNCHPSWVCATISVLTFHAFLTSPQPWGSSTRRVEFAWNSTYEKAFRQAKLHVANAVTLQYFDPGQPIVLECDASGSGVGGSLLQNGQPVVFILQALTDTQKRYSNIERELLAMVAVIENFTTTFLVGILQFILTIHLWSTYLKNV